MAVGGGAGDGRRWTKWCWEAKWKESMGSIAGARFGGPRRRRSRSTRWYQEAHDLAEHAVPYPATLFSSSIIPRAELSTLVISTPT
jgi:hypothetical protein